MASSAVSYIETELMASYNEGREDEARYQGMEYGVVSAILDSGTCEFCDWADGRAFPMSDGHLVPPFHFGCRCIISYFTLDMLEEDDLDIDDVFDMWEDPPSNVFPIGRKKRG